MDVNSLLNKGQLNGSEIDFLAKQMGMKVSIYQYDQLPKKLKPGKYVILIGNRAGHWIGVYVMKHTAAYYDSFGVPMPDEIAKAIGRRISFFSLPEEQKLNSNHCGQYTLRFLYRVSN